MTQPRQENDWPPQSLAGGYTPFHYRNRHGLKLFARDYRPTRTPDAPALVCLPGLSRNSSDFHRLALKLQADPSSPRRVIAFDYRGRGLSQRDADWQRYDVRVEAADIQEGLTALDVEHADFLGSSRGGLIIMVLAATRPTILRHVILNDIGPRIEQIGLLRIKAYLGSLETAASWADIRHALAGPWKEAFPATSAEDFEDFIHGLFRDEHGKPKALFDPALLTPVKNMDLSKPLPELWPQYKGLLGNRLDILRGEFSDLLSEETVEKMRDLHPDAAFHTVKGQGHAPLTNSATVIELIESLLQH